MDQARGTSTLPPFPNREAVQKLLDIDQPFEWWDQSELGDVLALQMNAVIADDVVNLDAADALAATRYLSEAAEEHRTYRGALLGSAPSLSVLKIVKKLAKQQLTTAEPLMPREIALLLHDLACAQAVRFHGTAITSKPDREVLAGLLMLLGRGWVPSDIKTALGAVVNALQQKGAL